MHLSKGLRLLRRWNKIWCSFVASTRLLAPAQQIKCKHKYTIICTNMTETGKPLVNVDIVSDVMCPWCWIGKKKLEAAMRQLEDKFQFRVRWQPYMLRPEAPSEGLPIPPGYRNPDRWEDAGAELGLNKIELLVSYLPMALVLYIYILNWLVIDLLQTKNAIFSLSHRHSQPSGYSIAHTSNDEESTAL